MIQFLKAECQVEDISMVTETNLNSYMLYLERNQLALDRYNNSHNKTKWQIGRDYEQYVGYQYRKKGYIVDELCGLKFKLSPKSFFQINPVQTELLYEGFYKRHNKINHNFNFIKQK